MLCSYLTCLCHTKLIFLLAADDHTTNIHCHHHCHEKLWGAARGPCFKDLSASWSNCMDYLLYCFPLACVPAGHALMAISYTIPFTMSCLTSLISTYLQSWEQLLGCFVHLASVQTPGSIWRFLRQETEKLTAEHILYLNGHKCVFWNHQNPPGDTKLRFIIVFSRGIH